MTTDSPPPRRRGASSRSAGTFSAFPRYLPIGPTASTRGNKLDSRLRQLRVEAGLSHDRLAELTAQIDRAGGGPGTAHPHKPGERMWGISAFSIERYENGIHAPRPRNLKLLTDALSLELGRRVTPDDLQIQGIGGLITYLEGMRESRKLSVEAFYGQLGIRPAKAQRLLAQRTDWTALELGRVAILFPEAGRLTQDVLVEQARRADPPAESSDPGEPGE